MNKKLYSSFFLILSSLLISKSSFANVIEVKMHVDNTVKSKKYSFSNPIAVDAYKITTVDNVKKKAHIGSGESDNAEKAIQKVAISLKKFQKPGILRFFIETHIGRGDLLDANCSSTKDITINPSDVYLPVTLNVTLSMDEEGKPQISCNTP